MPVSTRTSLPTMLAPFVMLFLSIASTMAASNTLGFPSAPIGALFAFAASCGIIISSILAGRRNGDVRRQNCRTALTIGSIIISSANSLVAIVCVASNMFRPAILSLICSHCFATVSFFLLGSYASGSNNQRRPRVPDSCVTSVHVRRHMIIGLLSGALFSLVLDGSLDGVSSILWAASLVTPATNELAPEAPLIRLEDVIHLPKTVAPLPFDVISSVALACVALLFFLHIVQAWNPSSTSFDGRSLTIFGLAPFIAGNLAMRMIVSPHNLTAPILPHLAVLGALCLAILIGTIDESQNESPETRRTAMTSKTPPSFDELTSRTSNLAQRYGLTTREHFSLIGKANGSTSKTLAKEMHVSPSTVRTYQRRALNKMGAPSFDEAMSMLDIHELIPDAPARAQSTPGYAARGETVSMKAMAHAWAMGIAVCVLLHLVAQTDIPLLLALLSLAAIALTVIPRLMGAHEGRAAAPLFPRVSPLTAIMFSCGLFVSDALVRCHTTIYGASKAIVAIGIAAQAPVTLVLLLGIVPCAMLYLSRPNLTSHPIRPHGAGCSNEENHKKQFVEAILRRGFTPLTADIAWDIASGKRVRQICEDLHVAQGTVNAARQQLYRAFDVHSAADFKAAIDNLMADSQ